MQFPLVSQLDASDGSRVGWHSDWVRCQRTRPEGASWRGPKSRSSTCTSADRSSITRNDAPRTSRRPPAPAPAISDLLSVALGEAPGHGALCPLRG